jgi:hypothetical protein
LASLSCRQQRSQRRPALGSIAWQGGLQPPCSVPLGPLGQVQQPRRLARRDDAKALDLMAKAEADGDVKTAGQMLRISLVSLELLARLRGELNEQQNTTVNVLLAPEWLATRAALLAALEPYVEARIAVSAALLAVEEGSSNGHSH